MTLEEEVEAYNLFQSGASIQEVATKLNKNISTIWRLAPGEPTRKYHHLHRYQKQEIDKLHEMKTPFKEIARVLDLPPRTVRYYLYEKEKK
jgi:IS30 family transposase